MSHRGSIVLAYVAVFSSLSIILAIIKAEIPFPLLTYLRFDLAEVPIMMVFMLGGPAPAVIAEVIHWIGLTLRGGIRIGPLMKFLAVISMIAGFWIGIEMGAKVLHKCGKMSLSKIFFFGLIFGVALRVIICTFTNIALFLYIDPSYFQFAEAALRTVGVKIASTSDVLMWTLILTGIFNMAHVPLSSVTSLLILKATLKKIPTIARSIWLLQL